MTPSVNELKMLSLLREQCDLLGIEYTSRHTISDMRKLLDTGMENNRDAYMTPEEKIRHDLEPIRVIIRPNDPDMEGRKSIIVNVKNRVMHSLFPNPFVIPLNMHEGFYLPRYIVNHLKDMKYYYKENVETIDVGSMAYQSSGKSQFQLANKYTVVELPKQNFSEYMETTRNLLAKMNKANKG